MSRLGYSFAPVPEQLAAAVVAGDVPDAAVTLWVLVNRATKGANTFQGSWAELAKTVGWTRDKAQRVGLAMESAGWATVVRSDGLPGAFLLHTTHGPIVPDDATGADTEPVADLPQVQPEPVGNLPQDPLEISHDPVGNLPRVSGADLGFHRGIEIESREIASKPASASTTTTTTDRAGSPPSAASPLVLRVGQALAEAGITVALVRKPEQVSDVERYVQTHGIPALVRHARAQYRPDRPPASMAAFLSGWSLLPPPRPKDGPLARPGSDHDTAPRVATEDRSPQVSARLAQVRAQLRTRRASTTSDL